MVILDIKKSHEIVVHQTFNPNKDGVSTHYIALNKKGPNLTLRIASDRVAMTETGILFDINGKEIIGATGTRTRSILSEYQQFELNGENYRASLNVLFRK